MVPKDVIAQARRYLRALESKHIAVEHAASVAVEPAPPQLALFAQPSASEAVLRMLDPDSMTPKEALEALYQLKKLV